MIELDLSFSGPSSGQRKAIVLLFFSAVLGSVGLTYLSNDLWPAIESILSNEFVVYPRLLFGPIFIVHWLVVFLSLYEADPEAFTGYSVFGYLMVLALLFASFEVLPGFHGERPTSYAVFYLLITAVGVVFVFFDVLNAATRPGHSVSNRSLLVDTGLAVWGSLFFVTHEIGLIHSHPGYANVFVIGTLLVSLAFFGTKNTSEPRTKIR